MKSLYELSADIIPEQMERSEFLRMFKNFLRVIQPHTHFECDRLTLEGKWNIETIPELLARRCDVGRGTKIINCVVHMGRDITERPDDCRNCLADLRNHMRTAIAINGWLNDWKADAVAALQSFSPSTDHRESGTGSSTATARARSNKEGARK